MIEIEYHYYPTSRLLETFINDCQCHINTIRHHIPPDRHICHLRNILAKKSGPVYLNFLPQKYRRQCKAFSRTMISVCSVFHYDLSEELGFMACGMSFSLSFIKNRKF